MPSSYGDSDRGTSQEGRIADYEWNSIALDGLFAGQHKDMERENTVALGCLLLQSKVCKGIDETISQLIRDRRENHSVGHRCQKELAGGAGRSFSSHVVQLAEGAHLLVVQQCMPLFHERFPKDDHQHFHRQLSCIRVGCHRTCGYQPVFDPFSEEISTNTRSKGSSCTT